MKQLIRVAFFALPTLIMFLAELYFGQTDPRMIVYWNPITPPAGQSVAKYIVETTVGSLPFLKAADCTAIPCTITGIEGTTTYKVRVAGVEPTGIVGAYSDQITFMFASIQPFAPTSLTQASATSTQPGKIAKTLSWTAVKGFRTRTFPAGTVVTYRIYQAGTSPAVLIATANSNSFTVQGLAKHKSFQFYVTAVVDGVESFATPAIRINT